MGYEFPIPEDNKISVREEPLFYDEKVKKTIEDWIRDISKYGFIYGEIADDEDSEGEIEEDTDLVGDPYSDIEEEDVEKIEGKGSLKGHCAVTLKNGDVLTGRFAPGRKRCGKNGSFTTQNSRTLTTVWGGSYDANGRLSGFGKAQLLDETVLEGFFEEGYLHGCVKGTNLEDSVVTWIGRYRYGKPTGLCWKFLEGGGIIVGRVNEKDGSFTGDNIAYLYPDRLTCIYGRFEDGVLIEGRASTVKGLSVNTLTREVTGISFNPVSPEFPAYRYCPSDFNRVNCPLLLEDPLESYTSFLGKSKISQSAGEGLFAKRDLKAGETVAFYNGLLIHFGEVPDVASRDYQVYVDWDLSKISKSDYMDIPPGLESSEKYRASLGHKINHSFAPNCRWDTILHPCFGRIPQLVTITNISVGEEFTCHYRIDMEQANKIDGLDWYVKSWENFPPSNGFCEGNEGSDDSECEK